MRRLTAFADPQEEKEAARAAARAAAAAAADACTLCGAQWGEAADRDELWVACGMCNRWYHGACAGTTQDEIDALGSAEWECPECQMHRCAPCSYPDIPCQTLRILIGQTNSLSFCRG